MTTLENTTTIEEWDEMRKVIFPDAIHHEYESCFFINGIECGTTCATWYCSTGQCSLSSRVEAVEAILDGARNQAFNVLRDEHGLSFDQAKVISSSVLPHKYNEETAKLVGYDRRKADGGILDRFRSRT